MKIDIDSIEEITGGLKTVGDDWMPSSATRSLLLDPVLIWLQFHGKAHGFERDVAGDYSLSEYIMEAGRNFEAAWITNVCGPQVAYCLTDDRDVRRVQGVMRTIELMLRRDPVIAHAALWNAKARIYGAADLLVLTSWLYDKFPHLKPAKAEPDHYVVLDAKFTRALHKPDKAKSFEAYSNQVRLYTYCVGQIQGYMPKRGYLVSRDRHDDPIGVEISSKLGKPLDRDLTSLRGQYVAIRQHDNWLPWKDKEVAPNWSNSQCAPWSAAKQRIAEEFIEGHPLEWLPRVGRDEAESLKALGYKCLDDALKVNPNSIPLETVTGIGENTARQIRAVLESNRSRKTPSIPAGFAPTKPKVELFIDYEFFPDLHIEYPQDFGARNGKHPVSAWPDCLNGNEMVFLIGCGWEDEIGKWQYMQFSAEQEDRDAEKKMWYELLQFLEDRGVLEEDADAALVHFSPAECWQSKRAAVRCGIPTLGRLPWRDLEKTVLDLPLSYPGTFSFGLKPLVKALSEIAPDYAVSWPTGLGDGASAAAVGWRMYEADQPLKSKEFDLLSQYLEVDCKSMYVLLKWLRDQAGVDVVGRKGDLASSRNRKSWYPAVRTPQTACSNNGWYHAGLERMSVTMIPNL